MNKDAYYFPHDSNAKDDPKCMMLIEQLGLEGYGIYWVLIEILRDQPTFKYPLKLIPSLARRFNTTSEKMNIVVQGYELFEIDEKDFFSTSLMLRMEKVQMQRENAKKAINARWSKQKELKKSNYTDVIRTYNESNSNEIQSVIQRKGKERKEKERKTLNTYVDSFITFFEECWQLYPRKEGKGSISDKKKKEIYSFGDEFKRAIQRYKDKISKDNIQEQYIKMGSSFFNTGYVDYLDINYQQMMPQKPLHRIGIEEDDSILIRREDY